MFVLRIPWFLCVSFSLLIACSAPRVDSVPSPGGQPEAAPAKPAAAPRSPVQLSVAYSAQSAGQTHLWIAKEMGYFRKYGLEVELHYLPSTRSAAALLAGEVQFAQSSAEPLISARLEGADPVIIATPLSTYTMVLMVRPEVSSIEDLRGKRIGVSQFGSTVDAAVRAALVRLGLDPQKDVTLIQMTDDPVRLAALEGGSVSAAGITPPGNVQGRKMGFREVLDISSLDIPFVAAGLTTTRAYAGANDAIVLDFLKAYLEGIKTYLRDREVALSVFSRYSGVEDVEVLEEILSYARRNIKPVPMPRPEGLKGVLDSLAERNPKVIGQDPNDFIDPSYMRRLEQSGFIRALHPEGP